MSKPPARLAIDSGPASLMRAINRRRVASPSAAKIAAGPPTLAAVLWRSALAPAALRRDRLLDILLDQRHLHRPAAFVGGERGGAALERNLVEAGLGHGQ